MTGLASQPGQVLGQPEFHSNRAPTFLEMRFLGETVGVSLGPAVTTFLVPEPDSLSQGTQATKILKVVIPDEPY